MGFAIKGRGGRTSALKASKLHNKTSVRKCLRKPCSIEHLEPRLMLAANLSLIEAGRKAGDFAQLQSQLNTNVYKSPVPLVGDQLAEESNPAGQIMAAVDAA